MDAKTEQAIIENLRNLQQAPTLIIITHRLSAVTQTNKIIVLEDGQIIQQGQHQDLISQPGWYQEQYYHQQIKGGGEDV